MGKKEDEATAARDYTMARLAACRGALALAVDGVDAALQLFCAPEDDAKGKDRTELLEAVDDHIGDAARAIQAAQGSFDDVDPAEGEPEPDDVDEDDDDEDDPDDEDDED